MHKKVCRKCKVVFLLIRTTVILPKYGQDSYFGMVYLLFYKDYHLTLKCTTIGPSNVTSSQ